MNRKMFGVCLIFVCYFISSCAVSGNDQPLNDTMLIKDFDSVIINTPGVMEIYQGTTKSLEINGDPNIISFITAEVTDRTLTISSEQDLPANSSITYILFVKDLSSVILNDFGVVKMPAYMSDDLDLIVNGSGRMDLGDINVKGLKFFITGSGSIAANSVNSTSLSITSKDAGGVVIESGQTVDLMLDFGSGTFLGADFKSTNATVNLMGSGSIQIWAVEKMDVTINGNGNVIYFGEPTLSMSMSGGGQLTGGGNK